MPIKAKKTLTSRGVRMMMDAALARAADFGITVTVAIVDDGGHLLMLERMVGGRFHTVHSATTKAVTAASNKRPTTTKGAQGQELDVLHALGLALAAGPKNWTAMEGGYPVMVENECIGGIGVSGGDWKQDATIRIEVGVGGVHLRMPRTVGVRVETAKNFLSGIHLDGFIQSGSDYYSENYDNAPIKVFMKVTTGIGGFKLSWI